MTDRLSEQNAITPETMEKIHGVAEALRAD